MEFLEIRGDKKDERERQEVQGEDSAIQCDFLFAPKGRARVFQDFRDTFTKICDGKDKRRHEQETVSFF